MDPIQDARDALHRDTLALQQAQDRMHRAFQSWDPLGPLNKLQEAAFKQARSDVMAAEAQVNRTFAAAPRELRMEWFAQGLKQVDRVLSPEEVMQLGPGHITSASVFGKSRYKGSV